MILRSTAMALALGATLAADLRAQEGCEFGTRGNDVVDSQTLPGIGRVTYVSNPHFVCAGGVEIFADSSVAYGDREMSHLIGNVRYVADGRELFADDARYFTNEGRLQAEGNVRVVDEARGSSIENGSLVYLLRTDFREVEQMTVTIGNDGLRPVALLSPARDSTDAPDVDPGDEPEPYRVVGDRIVLEGSDSFVAVGDVVIERDDLDAYTDSANYDGAAGGLVLDGTARIEGEEYQLVARRIDMGSPTADTSEVEATREARLTGDDILLTSARILMFLVDGAVQRLVATPLAQGAGPGRTPTDSIALERPRATVDDFVLTADSLEVTAPGESIERVFAAGQARSVSSSRDSLNIEDLPEIARNDWLEGDTVIVTFRPGDAPVTTTATGPPVTDSSGGVAPPPSISNVQITATREGSNDVQVDEIIAIGSARSLYRLEPSDTATVVGRDPPAVHYVVGREIRIRMEEGAVLGMVVHGETRGVHLEPLRRAVVADSAAAADTSVVPDTTGATPAAPPTHRERLPEAEPRPDPTSPVRQPGDPTHPDAPTEEVPWTRP